MLGQWEVSKRHASPSFPNEKETRQLMKQIHYIVLNSSKTSQSKELERDAAEKHGGGASAEKVYLKRRQKAMERARSDIPHSKHQIGLLLKKKLKS